MSNARFRTNDSSGGESGRVPGAANFPQQPLLALALTLGLAASAGAEAQNVAKESPDENSDQIQEVVVTAQFREQNLQSTPIAITAVTAAMIEARGQASIMDVANSAPGVTFASGNLGGSQTTSISIRGIGQTDFNLALEPGVGMYIDDVYYGTVYGSMMELLDLERVEVLRGPQGTLSGKNSEGGAVKLFSKQPSDQGGGYIEATLGSYQRRVFRAGDNFTLVPDKLFMRLSGLTEKSDGYVRNYDYACATGQVPFPGASSGVHGASAGCQTGSEGGRDSSAIRAALRYVASDTLEDTLTYDTTIDRSDPPPTVLIEQGNWHGPGYNFFSNPPNPNLITANFVPPPGSYYNYANYSGLVGTPNQYTLPEVSKVNAWGLANVLDFALPGSQMSFKLISALRKTYSESVSDGDASPLARAMNLWNVDYRQHTEEARLSGKAGTLLDWTVGAFYFKSVSTQGGRINIDGAGDTDSGTVYNGVGIPFFVTSDFLFDDPVRVESKSGFLHTEFHATDKLSFTAGTRYTSDFKSYQYARTTAPGYTPSLIDVTITPLDGLSGTFRGNRWDYRLTAAYQFTPDVNSYAQVATGFKGGGVNPRPFYPEQVQPFKPETVDSYELGLKMDLFDRRARINAALFYNQYKDMQLQLFQCPQFVPVGAPQNCAMPANVGNSKIKGAEIEAEVHPINNMLVNFSASYLDFQYTEVDFATTGVSLTDKTPFTPKWKLDAGAQYKIGLGSYGSITPRLDWRYQAEVYPGAVDVPGSRIPSYTLANARLTYRDEKGDWEVSAQATNLGNKYYYNNLYNSAPPLNYAFQYNAVNPGRPREFSITLKRNL